MLPELIIATSTVLLISCMCSLLEAALYSLPASQIEMLASQNSASGKILKKLHADIQRPISAILSLNTLANTGGAAIAGASFVGVFGKTHEAYFTGGLALAVLVFSEVIPKTTGVVYARSLARFIGRPIQLMVWLFAPFIWLNRSITSLITRGRQDPHTVTAEEIEIIARMSRQAGSIAPEQERVISNILNLQELRARDIMTPRTVVFTLDRETTLTEARRKALEWQKRMQRDLSGAEGIRRVSQWPHSRVPLSGEEKEEIVGLVLRRDVFSALADGRTDVRLADLERPVHTVPESARVNRMLQDFLSRREHLFIVIDEYGVFSGIVTLEDVLEEIVGEEIVGEFDPAVDMRERARRRSRRITRFESDE